MRNYSKIVDVPCALYIMEFKNSGFIKVGISNLPYNRLKDINNYIKIDQVVIRHLLWFESRCQAEDMEREVLLNFKYFRKNYPIKFQGYTECFYDLPFESLLDFIKTCRVFSIFKYNPCLTLGGVSDQELISLTREAYLLHPEPNETEVRFMKRNLNRKHILDMKSLVANIIVAKEINANAIYYCTSFNVKFLRYKTSFIRHQQPLYGLIYHSSNKGVCDVNILADTYNIDKLTCKSIIVDKMALRSMRGNKKFKPLSREDGFRNGVLAQMENEYPHLLTNLNLQ